MKEGGRKGRRERERERGGRVGGTEGGGERERGGREEEKAGERERGGRVREREEGGREGIYTTTFVLKQTHICICTDLWWLVNSETANYLKSQKSPEAIP